MATTNNAGGVTFKVLDAMEGPHRGRILRLRLQAGETPSLKEIKGARFRAASPDGRTERSVRVHGFVAFGGKPSDARLARTGRVDVEVSEEGDGEPVSLRWELTGPID